MPSYQCQDCRKTLSVPTKPSQCSYCGGSKLIAKRGSSSSPFIVQSGRSSATSPVPSGPPVRSSKGGMDEPTEPIVPTPPSYNAPRSRSSNSGNAWEIFNPVQLLVRMTMVGCVLGGLGYGLYRLGTWQSPETAKSIVPQDFKETDNTDWQHPPNNQVKNGQLQHRLTVPATQLSVLKDQNLGDSTVKTETRFESKTANQAITGLA
ncbi:MAG: hypothetical protein ACRC6M_14170, partial [Microcystaceae cyanobacterium]